MDCSTNEFCASLPPKTRKKLCAHCTKRFMKAKSMQLYADFLRSSMVIIDGLLVSSTSLGRAEVDHASEFPAFYFALPGRITNPHTTFMPGTSFVQYDYMVMTYLTDTWVATFDHEAVRQLFREDADFAYAVELSSIRIAEDLCQMVALLRANYTYYGVMHLMQILTRHRLYISQQQIADVMNNDRSSVSKAVSRIRKEHPEIWEAYAANKGRSPETPQPKTMGT